MSQIFVVGAERRSFDGAVVVLLDDGALGTSYMLPCETASLEVLDSNAYPALIDAGSIALNKALGVRLGSFDANGYIKNDHFTVAGGYDFFTQAFGPRTGGMLAPWVLALIPYSGAAATIATGLWFSTIALSGQVAASGAGSAWSFRLRGHAADPLNYYGAPAPALPSYAGTLGTGIGSMANSSFTNGASDSPTAYDSVRAAHIMMDNRLAMIPAMKSSGERICAGFSPGPLRGSVALTQLGGAASALPMTTGDYPLDVAIPDGSGSKTLTIATSLSWDSAAEEASSREFWSTEAAYTLFGVNSGNATGTASTPWPFVISYA